jgi:HAMP domain-containing protein
MDQSYQQQQLMMQMQQQQMMMMGIPMGGMTMNPFAQRGQTDLMLMNQLAQNFAPVMTAPQQQMRTGFESLPGFNQPGLMGGMMNMIVAPMLQQMMGKQGMMPGGISPQNLMDFMDSRQYQTDQLSIMSQLGERDEEGYYQTLRGMQALTGGPFNAPQRAAARNLASTAAGLTSTIAPFAPELIDTLSGRAGSAAVMGMRMQQFNRFKTDPSTGLMGYSLESNVQQAEEIFDEMFAPDNMSQMRGMRAGQVGNMYGELMKRGMIGGDARPFRERIQSAAEGVLGGGNDESIKAIQALGLPKTAGGEIDFKDMSAGQMDKLRGLEGVQGEMRSFNADKVTRSLEGYVDAVTTMREIFGDAGMSNAPMAKLIQGLEALSQGSMTQINPGDLNMMVRTTQQLAQQSGMTIDSAIMMQQQGATTLQGLGVERIFAPKITQGAMAFGQAADAAGVGAHQAWGLENMDFQRQFDQNARARAVASPAANAMGALIRAEEQFGGFGTANEEERQATALSKAIQEGRTEYTYKDEKGNEVAPRSVFSDTNLIQAMIARQGEKRGNFDEKAAGSRAMRMMTQEGANRERAFEVNAQDLARQMQPAEVREQLINPRATGVFGAYVDDEEDARKMAAAFSDTFTSMDRETATNTKNRNVAFAKAMRDSGGAKGLTDEQLEAMAADAYGAVDTAVRDPNNPFGGYRSAQNLMVQVNEGTLRDTAFRTRRARIDAGIKDAMTGLTGHGVLANLVDAVQTAGEDETQATLTDVLGKTFGGIQKTEVAERLTEPMENLREIRTDIERTQRLIKQAPDSAAKDKLLGDLANQRDTLKQRTDQLRDMAEREGLLEQQDILDITDIDAYEAAEETRKQNQMTAASFMIRPFGDETPEQKVARGRRTGLLRAEGTGPEQIGALLGEAKANELLDEFAKEVAIEEKKESLRVDLAAAETDEDKEDIRKQIADADEPDEDAVTAARGRLAAGEQELTDDQRIRLLGARRDIIRIAPTKGEVTAEMSEALTDADFKKFEDDDDVRRLFAGSRATQARMQKTGVTEEDLAALAPDVEMSNVDARLAELGLDPANVSDENKQRLLSSMRESDAYPKLAAQAVSSGEMDLMRERYEGMTEEQRNMLRGGSKDAFDRVQHLIDTTGTSRFVREAGGKGLMLRDELQDLQAQETKLLAAAGGDRGAFATGAFGGGITADRRLSNYFMTEHNIDPDKFFYDGTETDESGKVREAGELRDEYAKGDLSGEPGAPLTRADFEKTEGVTDSTLHRKRRAILASVDMQAEWSKLQEQKGRATDELIGAIGARGGRFTITPSEETEAEAAELGMDATVLQSLRSTARLKGVDITDERLRELTLGVSRRGTDHIPAPATDEEAKIMEGGKASRDLVALSAEQYHAISTTDMDQLAEHEYQALTDTGMTYDQFATARGQFETVRASRNEAVARMDKSDLSDPSDAMKAIGTAMGLEGKDLDEFRQNRQVAPKMGTGEGQAWAREITSSIGGIEGAAEEMEGTDATELFKDIQSALKGGKLSDALQGRTDSGELLEQGAVLQQTGMLDILAGGGTGGDIGPQLVEALKSLQDSQKTVADMKDRTMRITGHLQVSGATATLNAVGSGGANTKATT